MAAFALWFVTITPNSQFKLCDHRKGSEVTVIVLATIAQMSILTNGVGINKHVHRLRGH